MCNRPCSGNRKNDVNTTALNLFDKSIGGNARNIATYSIDLIKNHNCRENNIQLAQVKRDEVLICDATPTTSSDSSSPLPSARSLLTSISSGSLDRFEPLDYDTRAGEGFRYPPPRATEIHEETKKIPEAVEELELEVRETCPVEYTLCVIKPDGLEFRREIERRIAEEGFEILHTRWLILTPEQASEFYYKQRHHLHYARLVAYMSSESVIAHVLAKKNAIEDWKLVVGPEKVDEARLYYPDCIRALYGHEGESVRNVVHASGDAKAAEKDIRFFFPNFVLKPMPTWKIAEDYLWQTVNPVLAEGLIKCCRFKPACPVSWLGNWLLANNPNQPRIVENDSKEVARTDDATKY